MLDGLFSLTHILIILAVALLLWGIPWLLVFRVAKWWDKRLQHRPDVRVSFVGVALGGITANIASVVLAIPPVIYLLAKYGLSHVPEGSVTTGFLISIGAMSLGCSVLGGYVAARVAKHDELLNGLLSSFLCVAYWIVFSSWHSRPALVEIFPVLGAPAFALLGGYLRQTQKRMFPTRAY